MVKEFFRLLNHKKFEGVPYLIRLKHLWYNYNSIKEMEKIDEVLLWKEN